MQGQASGRACVFMFKSSHRMCSVKKGFFQKSHKIHRKTLVPESATATLLKMRIWHRCFPVNFAIFLRTPFLQNTSGLLLLLCWHAQHQLNVNYFNPQKQHFRDALRKRCSENIQQIYRRTPMPNADFKKVCNFTEIKLRVSVLL